MDDARTCALLGALSHPLRLRAYRLAAAAGGEGTTAGHLAESLNVRPSVLTSHIASLVSVGLIRKEAHGRWWSLVADPDIALELMRSANALLARAGRDE